MPHHKKVLADTFKAWLPFAIIILVFSGLVYVAVQQNYRQSANDPQIQIAEDLSSAILQGQASPDRIVPQLGTTEMADTLSPFVMIYNSTSTLIGSSVVLDGKNPDLPVSVLDNAKAKGESHITWQPKAGVREAIVILPFKAQESSGYIVVGRSLKQIEIRESNLLLMSELAGLLAWVLTFIVLLLFTNKTYIHQPESEKVAEVDIVVKS